MSGNTPLETLPAFLDQILGKVNTLDDQPSGDQVKSMLSNYAKRINSLAMADWGKNGLPGDVKFSLEGIGTTLQILAGEIRGSDLDRSQEIRECKEMITDCKKLTVRHIDQMHPK